MVEKIKDVHSPHGLERLAWRAPIWLYRLGLGVLFGKQFLLLNHVGRKTGKPRQAVLEVVHTNKETGAYVVASGFGEKSDWYRNIMSHPDVTIQVGRKHMTARVERLGLTEATEIMLDYNRRNPKLKKPGLHTRLPDGWQRSGCALFIWRNSSPGVYSLLPVKLMNGM